jgi:hypothetical protein
MLLQIRQITSEHISLYKREPKGCVQISIYHLLLQFQLVEETRGPRENHRPIASHRQTLSHNVVHLTLIEIRTHITVISGDRH